MSALLLIAGVFIGISFAAVGAGGAVLSIPALVLLGGLDVHQAITGGPFMVVAMAAATAFEDFRKSGKRQTLSRLKTSLILALPGLPAAFGGAWAKTQMPSVLLKGIFFFLVAWAAAKMIRPPLPCVDDESDGKAQGVPLGAMVAGVGLGFLSGLLGIGGGFLAVPLLVILFGYCTGPAARISVLLIFFNGLSSMVSNLALGGGLPAKGFEAVGLLLLGGLLGIPLGILARRRLPEPILRKTFAGILITAALLLQLR